jgi:hypothetical protein
MRRTATTTTTMRAIHHQPKLLDPLLVAGGDTVRAAEAVVELPCASVTVTVTTKFPDTSGMQRNADRLAERQGEGSPTYE